MAPELDGYLGPPLARSDVERPGGSGIGLGFAARAVAWWLGLFAVLRFPWVLAHVLRPFTDWQHAAALALGGRVTDRMTVGVECSGTDAIALCFGVILACPVAPGARARAAGVSLGGLVALNVVRLLTLSHATRWPWLFDLLHLYVWPITLLLAACAWMWHWLGRTTLAPEAPGRGRVPGFDAYRFFALATVLSIAGLAASEWILASPALSVAARHVAAVTGGMLGLVGLACEVRGAVLVTPSSAFVVTPECVVTPLIPVYLAAVLAWSATRARQALWIVAAPVVFLLLATARLTLVAFPPLILDSTEVQVHAFYQLLLGGAAIVVAAHRSGRDPIGPVGEVGHRRTVARVVAGLTTAVLTAVCLGAPHTRLVSSWAERVWLALRGTELSAFADPQGALAILPGYQLSLLCGLWVAAAWGAGRDRFVAAVATLGVVQLGAVVAIRSSAALAAEHPTLTVLGLRGLAVALPILLVWLATRPRVVAPASDSGEYGQFWVDVGDQFPELSGAPSTAHYRADEQRLLNESLPTFAGCRILKTDLWDEAKNTRILHWLGEQGAETYGVDISSSIAAAARAGGSTELRCTLGDVRRLPFCDASFEAIYSMGTIEHFADSASAVREMYRTLKPGGRAVVGVPNRWDPFLRPLLAAVLYRLGLYGYGYEKSFSRRALRAMLEDAGFEVELESGILFMPGWLRMLDLACYRWCRPLTTLTRVALWPFRVLDRRLPWVRRHGYLLATVGRRPAS